MRFRPRLMTACLLLAAPLTSAHAEEKLSRLEGVDVETGSEQVVVSVRGSRAPNFTSFTMEDPFRVVVDWAGSQIDDAPAERAYERGLVRLVKTRQFNSEAEKISRVIVELAQRTTYRVEAKGTTVRVVLDPVPDPLPAPEPELEPVPLLAAEPEAVPVPIVDGPLTEPDVAIPDAPPAPAPAKVAVAEAAPPKPEPAPAKPAPAPSKPTVEPVVVSPPVPVVDEGRTAVAVVEEAPAPEPATPAPAPVEEKVAPAAIAVAPAPAPEPEPAPELEPVPVVAEAPAPEPEPAPTPAIPEPAVEPEPAPEPTRLATFEPEVKPEREPKKTVVADAKVEMTSPEPAAPEQKSQARTQRLAAAMPASKADTGWAPPAVTPHKRRRTLPVVKIGDPQETLQPERTTPDDVAVDEKPPPTMPISPDAEDFDPGPRVMKYIGFRQMAQTSRVFVRMDGKARYRQVVEGDVLVIELVNTSVPIKNNTRALDTSYFNSPVLRVQAVPTGDDTRVEIKLRERGPFKVKRVGTTIAIDFSRAP